MEGAAGTDALLFQGSVAEVLPAGCTSAGGRQFSRACVVDDRNAAFASHGDVFAVQVQLPDLHTVRFGRRIKGRGITLPAPFRHVGARAVPALHMHRQVMSVQCMPRDDHVDIAAVDAFGTIRAARFALDEWLQWPVRPRVRVEPPAPHTRLVHASPSSPPPRKRSHADADDDVGDGADTDAPAPTRSCILQLQREGAQEAGWAGVALSASSPNTLVSCHELGKYVALWRDGHCARSLRCTHFPAAVAFLGASQASAAPDAIVVAAEGPCATVWDVREHVSGGVVASIAPSGQRVNALDARDDRLVVGGESGCVHAVDVRNWRVATKWRTHTKHEVGAVVLSPSQHDLCYVAGIDNEFFNGRVVDVAATHGKLHLSHSTGFRAVSPWVGVGVVGARHGHGGDTVLGISETGHVYAVLHGERMAVV